jgi:hypothetical protein
VNQLQHPRYINKNISQQKEKGDKDQNLLQQKTKEQQERKSNPKYK